MAACQNLLSGMISAAIAVVPLSEVRTEQLVPYHDPKGQSTKEKCANCGNDRVRSTAGAGHASYG